jgi:hypothetical protein
LQRNSEGHLDKAMRYLLDSDSTSNKCTDPIWLLGVQHPQLQTSIRRGCVTDALTQWFCQLMAAITFRTSTSSTVTAVPVGSNALSSSQNLGAHWLPCRFFVTRLDVVSLSLPLQPLTEQTTQVGRACKTPSVYFPELVNVE